MYFSPKQRKIIEANEPKILCLSSAASGKALPNSTKIPTTDGWKRVDEIKVGDYLINELGRPTQVLGVYPQGKKEVYKITFGDGRVAKCCKDHLWSVNKITWKNNNEYRDYTTEQLLKDGLLYKDRRAKFSIPCSMAIEWPAKQYDIDPYVMGVFLGDGCCKGKSQLVLSSKDKSIPLLCAEKMKEDKQVKTELWYNNEYQWRFYTEDEGKKQYFNTIEYFKKYKNEVLQYSYNKTIPEEYKIGSVEQRLSLIQGLMDTDGSIEKSNGQLRFTTTSYSLIKGVQEVLSSLGYVSKLYKEEREELYTNECYYILINIPNKEKEKLFRVERKKNIAAAFTGIKQKHNYLKTTIRSIENTKELEEMTCFYVDNPKHLFLMNDCIVTHNTRVLTERIRYLIVNNKALPEEICAISFTNMAAEEMKTRLGNISNGVFIGTIHSYANKICYLNGVSTSEDIQTADFDKILKKVIRINPKRYPKIKYLLIDECQDLGNLEHIFIRKIPTENIFYCGDFKQMIYSFRGVSGDYVKDLYYDTDFKKYSLIDNYRNPPNIINFANSFIDRYQEQFSPSSSPVKTQDGIIEECSFYDALDELEESEEWGSWFILTRTNNELYKAQEILDKRDIPNLTFKTGDLTLSQLKAFMGANKVKILTIHTSKGLSLKNVIVVGARTYNDEERRICYVAATRAENALYWCPSIAGRRGTVNKKNRDFTKEEGVINF